MTGTGPRTGPVRPIAGPLVLGLVLVTAMSGCGSDEEKKIGPGAVYAALGDSFTAAPGIDPIKDKRCGRSELNYPTIVARDLEVTKFTDVSCSGATTLDLEKPQTSQLARLNGPQLDAVTEDTTLVTIGMGLNNALISTGLLLTCLTPPGKQPSDKCKEYLSYPQAAVEGQLQVAAAQVEQSLETIAERAPKARIVLVGYPSWVPDEGSCPDRLPVPDAQVERMRDAFRFADGAWRAAAERAGATYVSMYDAAKGHDVCADDPWIAGARTVPGKAFQLHPFAAYEAAAAEQVVRALRG